MAREGVLTPLKRNADAFAGILAQALELEAVAGPFGLASERIDSVYLAGHGLVFEVRSSLATTRSRLNMAILNSSVIALRQGDNPFAMLARAARKQVGDDLLQTEIDERHPRFELLLRASEIDVSEVVDSAIVQAGEYARILRDTDGVDSDAIERLRGNIEALRRENLAGADRLRELTEELRLGAAEQGGRLEFALGELAAEMELLRSRAETLAEDLRQRSESAQAERAERWREDVTALEQRLALAMCDYGASLRELPAEESVTVILAGLGDESNGGGRADVVRTFSKADLLQCAGGGIDPVTLGERSGRYSY